MKTGIQKFLYSSTMLLAPAIVTPPFLLFKRGRERLSERFGIWNIAAAENYDSNGSFWLHGASLGEMTGIANIARELRNIFPEIPFVATGTSPTALPKAAEFASEVKLLPFDHPLYYSACIKAVSPKVFIFGETEIWPNLLNSLNQRKVPCYLVNGRISDRTFDRYLRFKSLIKDSLAELNHIFAASEIAQERFVALGAVPERISVVPNTKYDKAVSGQISAEERIALKLSLFNQDLPSVIFSSIRPGEDQILFTAIKELQSEGTNLQYIIAPRHAEKFSFFESKLEQLGLKFQRRSEMNGPISERFLLLDTVGELAKLYAVADLSFVGGTLADFGGHNPLEAAAQGVAPVIGPYHSTIKDVCELLRKNDALFEAATKEQVKEILRYASSGRHRLASVGMAALQVAQSFSGSSLFIASHIAQDIKNFQKI